MKADDGSASEGNTVVPSMTISSKSMKSAGFLAAALIIAFMPIQVVHAGDGIVSGYAAWQTQGQMSQSAQDEVTFGGELKGRIYLEMASGPMASGTMRCQISMKINSTDASQHGAGDCTITTNDDALAYAELKCEGVFMRGCDGTLTFTKGTARLAGISGSGTITFLNSVGEDRRSTEPAATKTLRGTMYFSELRYHVPN